MNFQKTLQKCLSLLLTDQYNMEASVLIIKISNFG